LRLYETSGKAASATVKLAWTPLTATATDLLEAAGRRLRPSGRRLEFEIAGSEIATMKAELAPRLERAKRR
ncbi:MAG: hypothetical protein JRN38_05500, partial [Nitrososphaerota archaeon]|nr:hypothetical protein [Nitrososphaerota archaeon]